ncbi:MAG: pantetheine-phosphate adenylyltransferase [Bacteroidetes bacterium]|nr:pantetheine-phosphate adenylyltransferase [Bacteroidota bacterium]
MQRIAVFPGSFDPITRGHESVVRRALPLFDQLIVAIGDNGEKKSFFPLDRRLRWLEHVFGNESKIKISTYRGLTIDFCHDKGAGFILRGLRTTADFEFERGIGQMNKLMSPDVETVFLLCAQEFASVSSSIVRDIIRNGGNVEQFVPEGMIIEC